MRVLAIDAGDVKSAYTIWDNNQKKIVEKAWIDNEVFLETLRKLPNAAFDIVVIEQLVSMGMPVGMTTFNTIFQNGRLHEMFVTQKGIEPVWVNRLDVKMHLCMSTRAKEGNVRQALVNRFGEPSTKKKPHDTYNELTDKIYFGSHFWSCLALTMYCVEPHHSNPLILDSYGIVKNKEDYQKGTVN